MVRNLLLEYIFVYGSHELLVYVCYNKSEHDWSAYCRHMLFTWVAYMYADTCCSHELLACVSTHGWTWAARVYVSSVFDSSASMCVVSMYVSTIVWTWSCQHMYFAYTVNTWWTWSCQHMVNINSTHPSRQDTRAWISCPYACPETGNGKLFFLQAQTKYVLEQYYC